MSLLLRFQEITSHSPITPPCPSPSPHFNKNNLIFFNFFNYNDIKILFKMSHLFIKYVIAPQVPRNNLPQPDYSTLPFPFPPF